MKIRNKIKRQNRIKHFLKNFKFKSLNLSFSKQLILLGSLIGFISLFMPWIKDTNEGKTWNAFYSLTGNIGFLLIIILIIPVFVTLSTSYKEKIKLYSDLSLKNHFMIITSGFFVISFSIITLSFVNGLHTFFENTFYGNGVILCMTSGFIILIGGLMIRKEYYSSNSEIILNKLNQNREKLKEKDNMKLPF
ncbi:MAG: hypothetical protein QM490_03330 [Candidatus Gracilibacteria bacterium]